MKVETILNKMRLYNSPFWLKLLVAKIFIRMFKGFGPTYHDDLILYNELRIWIETKGKPTTTMMDGGEKGKELYSKVQINN